MHHDKLTLTEELILRYHNGEYNNWNWEWRPRDDKDLRADVVTVVKAEFDRIRNLETMLWGIRGKKDSDGEPCPPPKAKQVTTKLIGNVLQALAGCTRLVSNTTSPAWLTDNQPFPADEVLPARNALVHLSGLVENRDAMRPPSPTFWCSYALDYDFDRNAPEPVNWLTFLGTRPVVPDGRVQHQLWPDDPESIQTLQEWMGYLLTPDTSHEKILMLIGPKRSGKGTIARLIRAMIGAANVANPTLSSLGTNFGLAPLIGKPVAVITDARLSGRTDIAQTVERLLSISGEDGQTIDRKFLAAWTGTLPTRFMIISNELPRIPETSGALASRLIILKLTKSFYGKEDRALTQALMAELPGILIWAIEGWRRLRERGYFVQPKSSNELVREMEDLASPVGAFLRDCCEIAPGQEVKADDLFRAWSDWCESTGRKHHGTAQELGRDLRALMPHLSTTQHREDGRKRSYQGVGLKPKIDELAPLVEFLKGQIDAGLKSVRGSINTAGAAGLLKRKDDGKWDASPVWAAGRRLGYVPTGDEGGKYWGSAES